MIGRHRADEYFGRHRRPNKLWRSCQKGGGAECPKCVPPVEERCPERSYADKPCHVLGEHDRHNDGYGCTWVYDPPSWEGKEDPLWFTEPGGKSYA